MPPVAFYVLYVPPDIFAPILRVVAKVVSLPHSVTC